LSLNSSIKTGIGYACDLFNILDLFLDKQSKPIVLCYHRVVPYDCFDLKFCSPGMYVSSDTFRCHIEFLKEHFNIVPLESIVLGSAARRACAITFDDGWWDNYSYAFPILKEFDVPATVFLATGFVENQQWPWPDRFAYYLRNADRGLFFESLSEAFASFDNGDAPSSDASEAAIINAVKRLSHKEICELADILDAHYPDLYQMLHNKNPALSWGNIEEMRKHGVTFGLHSHSHIIANDATPVSVVEEDYFRASEVYKARVGTASSLFAYPNGNFGPDLIRILRNLGMLASFTTQPGFVDLSETMTINRILVHDDISSSRGLLTYRLLSSLAKSVYRTGCIHGKQI